MLDAQPIGTTGWQGVGLVDQEEFASRVHGADPLHFAVSAARGLAGRATAGLRFGA
jgi:hypothetical protein